MLKLKNISVSFPGFSLHNIDLNVEKGDYFTILGMSGAGKTIMLELIAGLLKPGSGQIFLNGEDITNKKICERKTGLVYQNLSLFPHMTVSKNILYPLKNKGLSHNEKKKLVSKLANHMEISHLLDRYPGNLSGGEAQRVALARTLASEPEILLLDEPLASLDVKLKSELRRLLKKINRSGKTIIHVTHDYAEAATLSNKVAVIENGRLIQTGTPETVFRHPANEFVARFSGYKNLFPCLFEKRDAESGISIARINKNVGISFIGEVDSHKGYVIVPEKDIIISENELDTSAINQFCGTIKEYYQYGYGYEIIIDAVVDYTVAISNESFNKLKIETGKKLWLNFKASSVKVLKS